MGKYHMVVMTGGDEVSSLADGLADLFSETGTAARVVTHCISDKMNQGAIVIAWDDVIPHQQLHQLNIENDIVDYFILESLCKPEEETTHE
ncbi:MAG TPA: hypothetical protein VKR06_03395 [Ktedonosporobacter sp.]|nr:hypothetical protein [Ktedonosporobacter sp.]